MSEMSEEKPEVAGTTGDAPLNLPALIPDLFAGWMEFFRPGHTQGIAPARVKELARLKIAALNGCDT